MKKTRLVPFSVQKAKDGAKIVTRSGVSVRIADYKHKDKDYPILGIMQENDKERSMLFTKTGNYYNDRSESSFDLFIEEEIKTRRMTNQELAWWLRDHPEEHRELKMSVDDPIIDSLYYYDNETNETVNKDIIIRRNGGEWEEPLIEI